MILQPLGITCQVKKAMVRQRSTTKDKEAKRQKIGSTDSDVEMEDESPADWNRSETEEA